MKRFSLLKQLMPVFTNIVNFNLDSIHLFLVLELERDKE